MVGQRSGSQSKHVHLLDYPFHFIKPAAIGHLEYLLRFTRPPTLLLPILGTVNNNRMGQKAPCSHEMILIALKPTAATADNTLKPPAIGTAAAVPCRHVKAIHHFMTTNVPEFYASQLVLGLLQSLRRSSSMTHQQWCRAPSCPLLIDRQSIGRHR